MFADTLDAHVKSLFYKLGSKELRRIPDSSQSWVFIANIFFYRDSENPNFIMNEVVEATCPQDE